LLDEGLLVQNVTCRFSGAFTRPGSTSWLGTHALSLWAESNDAGAVVGTSDSSQTDQLAKTGESNHYEWITGRFCLCSQRDLLEASGTSQRLPRTVQGMMWLKWEHSKENIFCSKNSKSGSLRTLWCPEWLPAEWASVNYFSWYNCSS
jgi:hypothetical protein